MTKAELDAKLTFIFEEPKPNVEVYAVSDGEEPKWLDIEDKAVQELIGVFGKHFKSKFFDKEAYEIKDYSTTDERKDVYYRYDLVDDVPVEIERIKTLLANRDSDKYGKNGKTIDDIAALYIRLSNNQTSVTLYKVIYNVEKTYTNKNYYITTSNTKFVKAASNLLHISPAFQILYVDEDVILVNLDVLEKKPGFEKVLRNQGEKARKVIDKLKLVEDMKKIKAMCDKIPYCRKLMQTVASSKVIEKLQNGTIDNAKIIKYAKDHAKLKLRFNRSGTKFKIESEADAKRFIKLLNDDFLKSEITEEEYDIKSKDPMA